MITAAPSAALATIQPAFTDPERLATRSPRCVVPHGPRDAREPPLCVDLSSMPIRIRIFQIRAYARTGLGWEWIAGHHSMRRGLLS